MRRPPKKTPRQDAIGRRLRHIPQSTGKRIELTETDTLRFEFLHRHGDLPAPFVHEYTRHLVKNYQSTYKRLGRLFHEKNTDHKGTYLERDPRQWATRNSDYNYIVYRTNKRSEAVLQELGRYKENTPHTSSSWTHDFLRACYSASIELACLREPDKYGYIHHDEIMDRIGEVSFSADGETFRPDLIHGIRYKENGSARLFMVEIDCNTEQGRSTKKNRDRTYQHKLEIYKSYISGGLYKEDFGMAGGLMMVTVTTNPTHLDNLVEIADNLFENGSNYMLFNYVDGFGYYFEPPKEAFPLFEEPWIRAGRESFQMNVA